jgi:uncharacterized protein (TIGR03435 family)
MEPPFRLILICLIGVCQIAAQQQPRAAEPAPAALKFEVVSIKPCKTAPAGGGSINNTPGSLRIDCTTVEFLIGAAYIMYPDGKAWEVQNGAFLHPMTTRQMYQPIKGSVGWIKSERFTINAKANRATNIEMMRGPMMQAVLKDRFKLAIHRETRDTPVYNLVIGKGGSKLKASKDTSCIALDPAKGPPAPIKPGQSEPTPICGAMRRSKDGGVDFYGTSLDNFCSYLSSGLERDVVDRTGLTGLFDVHLDVAMEQLMVRRSSESQPPDWNPLSASESAGTIPAALHKLGLQLQAGKKPTESIVIDHLERPTVNRESCPCAEL